VQLRSRRAGDDHRLLVVKTDRENALGLRQDRSQSRRSDCDSRRPSLSAPMMITTARAEGRLAATTLTQFSLSERNRSPPHPRQSGSAEDPARPIRIHKEPEQQERSDAPPEVEAPPDSHQPVDVDDAESRS